jgi:pre-mRNA-processing factor 6
VSWRFLPAPVFFSRFAGTWFNRAVTLDPDFGDAWAHFYKFEQINGSKDNTDAITQRVKKSQPRHGQLVLSCF